MELGRKDKVPGPAEVWGLARAEKKGAVAADKANGPDGVAAAVVARGKAAMQDVEGAAKLTDSRAF